MNRSNQLKNQPEATRSVNGKQATEVIHESLHEELETPVFLCALVRSVMGFFLREKNIESDLHKINKKKKEIKENI